MAEGIELNGRPKIEASGKVPDLLAEQRKRFIEEMTPKQREEYEFVQKLCEREAYLFKQALEHVLSIMPQPAKYHEHRLDEAPLYDQGTVLVALKVYENARREFLEAVKKEEGTWFSRAIRRPFSWKKPS